jgi:hypothetical protein
VSDAAGKIITFYSYKGGTGRSMVLANVAYILSRPPTPRKILMIDWDLEAPGLHSYFAADFPQPAAGLASIFGRGAREQLARAPGLIELMQQAATLYKDLAPSGGLSESRAHTDEAVKIYAEFRRQNSLESLALPVGDGKSLFLLKAGSEDRDYANRVRRFDWEGFYTNYGSFFTHLRQQLMEQYTHVFIDSRTGVTDTSGICTRVMPEKLVGVFAPNRQNIEGLVEVIRGATEYRRNSRDPRALVVFPLASRIVSHSTLRTIWWKGGALGKETFPGYEKIFEDLFREMFELDECRLSEYFDATQVPHDPDYAYGEEVAAKAHTGTSDKLSIETACANFAERLVTLSAPWETPSDQHMVAEARRQAERDTRALFAGVLDSVRAAVLILVLPLAVVAAGGLLMNLISGRELPDGLQPLNSRLGYTADDVHFYLLNLPVKDGLERERLFVQIDLLFPVFYGAAFVVSLLSGLRAIGRRAWLKWMLLPVIIGVLADWLENLMMLRLLDLAIDNIGLGGIVEMPATTVAIASAATLVKLVAIGVAGLLLVIVVALIVRNAAFAYGGAAASGARSR